MSAAFAAPPADAAGDAVISIRELTKRYGELVAVDGISFEARRGAARGRHPRSQRARQDDHP